MNQGLGTSLLVVLVLAVLTYAAYFIYWAFTTESRRRKIVVKYVKTKTHLEFYNKTSVPLITIHKRIEEGRIKTENLTEKQRKKTEQNLKIYGALKEFYNVSESEYYVRNFIHIPDENVKQYIYELNRRISTTDGRGRLYRYMHAQFILEKESIPDFLMVFKSDQKLKDIPNQITLKNSPEFSEIYRLRIWDEGEEAVNRLFTPELQQFLIRNPHFKLWGYSNNRIQIEVSDSKWFAKGLAGETVKEKYIVNYLEAVEELFAVLRKSSAR